MNWNKEVEVTVILVFANICGEEQAKPSSLSAPLPIIYHILHENYVSKKEFLKEPIAIEHILNYYQARAQD